MPPFLCKHDSICLVSFSKTALLTQIDQLRLGEGGTLLDVIMSKYNAHFRAVKKWFIQNYVYIYSHICGYSVAL